ncbi:RNA methyltransferase [Micromonospora sp. NPDC126480]|uniref:TrmH family RNA methyltransferase n=1 Tax=Micromonospora sp. NPDC126480 TaxID=3155312 RepID=UPI003324EE21
MQSPPQGRRLDAVAGPFTPRTPRVVAARRLQRRRDRDAAGRFLAEGPQAVREALARPRTVLELFGTPAALDRYADLAAQAATDDVEVSEVTDEALAALAETVAPQGLVAVCRHLDVPLDTALGRGPRLVAVLAGIRDPGNAGTVLRTADAAGAQAVVFAGEAVDPYNGKAVRASAGSLFHVDVVRAPDPLQVVAALRAAGLTVLATTGYGTDDLDDLADAGRLVAPTAWVFGSEAHGLPDELTAAADARVRVPLHGRAESLNLAAAAAVCLYASARAQRRPSTGRAAETAGENVRP